MRRALRAAVSARPSAGRAGAAFVLGVGVAAGQAPVSAWWVALPALSAVTFLVAAEPGALRRAWIGWLAGLGNFAAALAWIVEPFLVQPEIYGWMAPFALFFMAGGLALFWGLGAFAAGLGPGPATRAAGFAVALAGADLLRGYVFTGFPWALVGHVWIGTPVAQAAAAVGAPGLSLLTGVAAALPAIFRSVRGRAGGVAAAIALVASVWAMGAVRLEAPEPPRDPAIRVRIVQPNATQALKWQEGMWRVFLDRQMQATAAPSDRPLDLVVWPETSVPYLLGRSGPLLPMIAEASGGVPVALGIQREEGPLYFNSLVLVDGTGAVAGIYDKTRLTPFGEYVPLSNLLSRFGIGAFAAQQGFGYAFGTGARVLDFGRAGRVLPLICYEAIFPAYPGKANERPDWILQVTNDGWFGTFSGPYQHLAQVRLRAIEQGLPVLRSANTGVSAVIDAKGRVIDSLPLDTDGWIDADVPGALPQPPYARTGDLPVAAIVAVALAGLAAVRRRVSG